MKVWQAVSGGGEDGETPLESAKRELSEEIGLENPSKLFQLSSISSIPVEALRGFIWGKDVFVVPEYTFGLELTSKDLVLSHEHESFEWLSYEEANQRLQFDSNKTALWELNARLTAPKDDSSR